MSVKPDENSPFDQVKPYLYLILGSVAGFVVLLYLTLLFSIYLTPYIFGMILVYVILLPLLTLARSKYTYLIILPVPYLGSWAISVIYLSSFVLPILQASLLASIIPSISVTPIHIASRMCNTLGPAPMASMSRTWFAVVSGAFFVMAPFVLGPKTIVMQPLLGVIYYLILLLAYIMSSMILVNSFYRYRVLCNKLDTWNIERKMAKIWKSIEGKFSGSQKDLDLLRYYFSGGLRLFEEGAYEESFISGYKAIREETIADPKEYVSDAREGEPALFSDIRTVLMHSRSHRKGVQIDLGQIRETKRKLPQYCVEVLQRGFTFLEKLAG